MRKDALDVVQGVADNEMEGSERRERRRGRCHGRRVTRRREEGDVTIRMGGKQMTQALRRFGGAIALTSTQLTGSRSVRWHRLRYRSTLGKVTSFSRCTHRDMVGHARIRSLPIQRRDVEKKNGRTIGSDPARSSITKAASPRNSTEPQLLLWHDHK